MSSRRFFFQGNNLSTTQHLKLSSRCKHAKALHHVKHRVNGQRRYPERTPPAVTRNVALTNQRRLLRQVTHSRQFRLRSARQAAGSMWEMRKETALCFM